MDPLTLLKEWGPWAFTVLAIMRIWPLIESEIKDSRETRKERQKKEAENDEKALGHLEAIRATTEKGTVALEETLRHLKGGRE